MDPNTTISGPSMCRQIMAQHWELCDLKGIRTSIAEKPYNFCNFPGGGGGGPDPSGSAHDGATIDDEVRESGSTLIAIIIILKC